MLIVSIIFVQIIIFVGLIYFFRRILTKNVVSATKHIDELNQEYDKRDKEAIQKLADAKREAQTIVAKAVDEAQIKREEVLKKTEKEKEAILKQAHSQSETVMQQAEKSSEQLLSEIDERITKAAINRASELIQYALPEELKRTAHSRWVKDLIDNGIEKIGKVKIVEGLKEIKVISAFPLESVDRTVLSEKLNKLFGSGMKLREEVDTRIVAGIIIEIGSLVLDGSLRNKIMEQSSSLDTVEKGAGE